MAKFPQAPSSIDPDAMAALEDWALVTPEENELRASGARRNVLRHAEAWGPHLLALLSSHGYLKPGQSPLEALEEVLDLANADEPPAFPVIKVKLLGPLDIGVKFSVDEFRRSVADGFLTEYDGYGYFVNETHKVDHYIQLLPWKDDNFPIPEGFTHVMWYPVTNEE